MRVVRGKRLVPAEPELLAGCRDRRVVVDVGTGDGRTAYRLARAHPEWLVVGVDPAWQRMVETSTRSARRPERGGAGNLVLVCATAEAVPDELLGIADEVLVLMPWGKLLRGIVLGEPDVCAGLRSLARAGATLELTVGTGIWRTPVPIEIRDLPELTPEYVDATLAALLAQSGWHVTEAREITADEVARLPSSWARRFGDSSPNFLYLRAEALA